MRRILNYFVIAFLSLGFYRTGFAQDFRGGISGRLVDPSESVVTATEITATEQATGIVHKTKTSTAGEYNFTDLPVGAYTVTTIVPGFTPLKVTGIHIAAGSIYGLPLKLSVVGDQSSIEVDASGVSLDTETSTVTADIPGEALHDIPFHSGDFLDANSYIPGYSGSSNQGNGSINGTRSLGINYELDGTDNNDAWHNRNGSNEGGIAPISGALLPIDALDGISFQTASDSDVGRSPAGTLNTILKSGTNSLHGSGYYFLRNEALSVANPFLPLDRGTPHNRNALWGGSLGGPIVKDRTFFFTAFEAQQFSFIPIAVTTEPGTAYQAIANGLLAAHGVQANPVTSGLLKYLWPSVALSNPVAAANNYVPSGSDSYETGYSYNFLAKVDHTFNSRNSISGHWYIGEGNQTGPGNNLKEYYEVAPMHVQNYNVVYNHSFTPTLTNQLLLGASEFLQRFHDYVHNQDPSTVGFVTGSEFPGAPIVTITGFDGIGANPPSGRNSTTGHFTDNASWTVGKHQIRFGGEYRRVHTDEFNFGSSRGTLTAQSATSDPWYSDTAVIPTGGTTAVPVDANAKALADFLAGRIFSSGITLGNQERLVLLNTFAAFASDTWKLTPKLELNFGLRYEYQGAYYNSDKNLSSFVESSGVEYLGSGLSTLYPVSKTPFAPRAGFAYQAFPGIVIRGGAGLYYDTPATDNLFSSGDVQSNPGGSDPVQAIINTPYVPVVSGTNYFGSAKAKSILSIYTASQTWRSPRNYNFYLQTEKSLGSKAVFQLGYVGTEGRNLIGKVDLNPSALNPTGNTVQSTRAYATVFPTYGNITEVATNTSSNYSSLQAVIKTSQYHGLAAQAAYTWSHNLDYFTSATLIPNYYKLRQFYATADIDQTHVFTGYASYSVPHLVSGPQSLTGGWELASGFNFHSGQPFTITYPDNTGSGDGTQYANALVGGNPRAGGSRKIVTSTSPYSSGYVAYLNPTAIANSFSAPSNGTIGTERRNQIRGPGYADVDLSVIKNIKFTERTNLQLRAELNNVYDHLNLASPTASFTSSAVGRVTGTIGGGGSPGVAPGEPFNAQLVARFSF
jgi:hypothetical protein